MPDPTAPTARWSFDAQATVADFDRGGAVFALGDGSVRFASGERQDAHDGAVLSAAVHPSGDGLVTGGDDGRIVWSRRGGTEVLAEVPGRWIDSVATSAESGLIAAAAGRSLVVLDAADRAFRRDHAAERTLAAVAFDPKGRRVAAATYGGALVWFARIAEQRPTLYKWGGSHTAVAWSPDGAFLITAMQDNQLHGWRLKDVRDMRMGGYPSKIRNLAFLSKGQLLATPGAQGAVLWPFVGANGPMGREATEIGFDQSALVTLVAARPAHGRLVAGLDDGRVWVADPAAQGLDFVRADKGVAITALALSPDGQQVAWGDEDGEAGVAEVGQ